ncbi:MAG: T9SS type A sorting domain-containing protein [Bacteroidales bacterium]|nr:T9SS type A sorting domain-containing protein [Bacteroidales bacterium]
MAHDFTFCSNANAVLTATPGFNGTTCRWYASATDSVVLATDTMLVLNDTSVTTFYVASYDAGRQVESPERLEVNITFIPAYFSEEFVQVCPDDLPYFWNGENYYVSGTHTATRPMESGCDSIAILHLTVGQRYFVGDYQIVCANELPYEWNGIQFDSAGVQTVSLPTVSGCDSVITMHLDVLAAYDVEDSLTICSSELPYTWNGVVFTEAGTQVAVFPIIGGCDSTVTMHLAVNTAYYENDTVYVTEFPYVWNGVEFTAPGTQTLSLQTAGGCDSVITMNVLQPQGISAYDVNASVSIYPNPTTGMFNVHIAQATSLQNSEIQIFDVYGKLLQMNKISTDDTVVNLNNVENGIYFVRVLSNGNVIGTAKVVKQ